MKTSQKMILGLILIGVLLALSMLLFQSNESVDYSGGDRVDSMIERGDLRLLGPNILARRFTKGWVVFYFIEDSCALDSIIQVTPELKIIEVRRVRNDHGKN